MTKYDPLAAGARRFPRDDARHFRQGYCYQEPDHTPYHWDQANFDEAHYCRKGKIRLKVEDAAGRVVYLEAGPGEHIVWSSIARWAAGR